MCFYTFEIFQTILNIYEIEQSSLRLQNKQSLTVNSQVVHILTFQKHNLIVPCSSKQSNCKVYIQMPDGSFGIHKQRLASELAFDHLEATSRFIMASRQNKIMIFPDHHLDCYGSFVTDIPEIYQLLGFVGPAEENYVLLISKTPFKVLIRSVEVELGAKYRSTRATTAEKGGE